MPREKLAENGTWPDVELNDGISLPGLGFGTWRPPTGSKEVTADDLVAALGSGIRHLDTAPSELAPL